jgi:hypothetical protein
MDFHGLRRRKYEKGSFCALSYVCLYVRLLNSWKTGGISFLFSIQGFEEFYILGYNAV